MTVDRAEMAMKLEDGVGKILEALPGKGNMPVEDAIARAQVLATLSLGQRVASLTEVVAKGLDGEDLAKVVGSELERAGDKLGTIVWEGLRK